MESIFGLFVMEASEAYGIENPHDTLFKDLLDDEEELKAFITEYVGINIKQEEIERYNNKYITNQYKIYEADMVYKIKEKEIYFLIEHQSTIDERMSYRILTYYTELLKEIIDKKENRRKDYKYPLIIPIVLYTGEREWKVEKQYSNKIQNYNNIDEKYIEMKYKLVDINKYTEEDLLKRNSLLSYAMLLEKNRGKDSLIKILEKISVNCKINENKEKMKRIIKYILHPILGEDIERIIEKFNEREEVNMKTAQDYIREEMAEIRREGKKEGINFVIINMIKNKVETSKIKQYTGVTEEEINKIVANM